MSSRAYPEYRPGFLAALSLGAWAAAIAIAQGLAGKALRAAPAAIIPLVWWTVHKPYRWVPLFFVASLLLPPLPIPVGESGPHPCLLLAALGLFSGLLWMREWRVVHSGLNRALAVLFCVLLASVAPAALYSGETAATGSLVRVLLFGISVYLYFHVSLGPGRGLDALRETRRLYWIAAAAALFACVDFYFQFPAPAGYAPQFVWMDTGVYRRAQGLFYEASTLGNFCAFFLVMIAVALSRPAEDAPVSRKALAAGGAVFFVALVLSYSRASLINLLVALAVLVWRNRQRVHFARVIPAMAICATVGAWLTWRVYPSFAQLYWVRLSYSAEYFFTATEGVLSGRVASWRTLAAWTLENPWRVLFGIGYKTLPYSNHLGAPVIADNMYLSLLVETGIGGLAALLWLNGAILSAAGRASHSANRQTSFFGTWILCFWAGQMVQMFSGDLLTYWRVLPVYLFVLALAVRV